MHVLRNGMMISAVSVLFFAGISVARPDMIANIDSDVETPFGTYRPVPVNVTPAVPLISVDPAFENVHNFDAHNPGFTARDSMLLRENHFTVRPAKIYYSDVYFSRKLTGAPKQMHYIYNDATHYDTPIFITADAVLHIYHMLFGYSLSQIEQERFYPMLGTLIDGLIGEIEHTNAAAAEDMDRDAAQSALAYLWVAKSLISADPVTPPAEVASLVDAELQSIDAHTGFSVSPIFAPGQLDYSQFVVRGHYTKTDELKRYFKTMMWLGLTSFDAKIDTQTLAALMLTQAVYRGGIDGTGLIDLWDAIYEPTVFFVGSSDDPNVLDYRVAGERIFGDAFLFADPATLADGISLVMDYLHTMPRAAIPVYSPTGESQGFRLMGQRFIPDSYMFAELVHPQIQGLREFPRGLDVMSVLGSDRARYLLETVYNEDRWAGWPERMDELKIEFETLPSEDWAKNLYWNWLYSLMPLLNDKVGGYPSFMRTDAWRDRELIAALGSWTQLRHDTILYAKQSGGIVCEPPGPPRSYVEPNPDLYARLLSLVRYTKEGLASRDLLTETFEEKLDLFDTLLAFLLDISIKQLENVPIRDGEYADLYAFGDVMEQLVTPPREIASWNDEASMAIIADVHTGITSGMVLEEAVGHPLEVWVIVGTGDDIRLSRGAMFSYYEFTWPMADRLTDEKWREMLDRRTEPDMPQWIATIMDVDAPRYAITDKPSASIWSHEFDPTAIRPDGQPVREVTLHPNRPNPFNPETFIRFELPEEMLVRIDIYDASGRHIRTLTRERFSVGSHTVVWHSEDDTGRQVASGMYILRMTAGDQVRTQRMTLLR